MGGLPCSILRELTSAVCAATAIGQSILAWTYWERGGFTSSAQQHTSKYSVPLPAAVLGGGPQLKDIRFIRLSNGSHRPTPTAIAPEMGEWIPSILPGCPAPESMLLSQPESHLEETHELTYLLRGGRLFSTIDWPTVSQPQSISGAGQSGLTGLLESASPPRCGFDLRCHPPKQPDVSLCRSLDPISGWRLQEPTRALPERNSPEGSMRAGRVTHGLSNWHVS